MTEKEIKLSEHYYTIPVMNNLLDDKSNANHKHDSDYVKRSEYKAPDDHIDGQSTAPIQNKVVYDNYYNKDTIDNLLNAITLGLGKLLSIEVTNEGILIIDDNGYNYYTDSESDNRFLIDVQQTSPGENNNLTTYTITQGTGVNATTAKINVPKDYLVKGATLKTCSTANTPAGCNVGDKYIDFEINSKDASNSSGSNHIYLNVKDLVDVYNADETTITKDNNNVFSIIDEGHDHKSLRIQNIVANDDLNNSKFLESGVFLCKSNDIAQTITSGKNNNNEDIIPSQYAFTLIVLQTAQASSAKGYKQILMSYNNNDQYNFIKVRNIYNNNFGAWRTISDSYNTYNKTETDTLLNNKISKSSTSGLIKNDGTIDSTSYLTSSDLNTKTVTVNKQGTPTADCNATYVISQGGTAISTKIDIPKELESVTLKTSQSDNSPTSGFNRGDKYIDFKMHDNTHLYLNVSDLASENDTDNIIESSTLSVIGTSQNASQHDINLAIDEKLGNIETGEVDLSGTHEHTISNITDLDDAFLKTIINPVVVPNGANLNTYTTPGFYYQYDDNNTTTMENLPENIRLAFNLRIEQQTQYGVTQYITFNNINDVGSYVRFARYNNGTYTWSDWKKYSYEGHTHSASEINNLTNYTADESTLTKDSNNQFSIKNSGVTLNKLNTNVYDTTNGGTSGSSKLITSGAVYNGLSNYIPKSISITTTVNDNPKKSLNDYYQTGFYYCSSNAQAGYLDLTSLPEDIQSSPKGFFLLVENWGSNNTIKQTFTVYNNGKTYIRYRTSSSASWSSWKELAYLTHNHGSITSDGKIGSYANKPLITTTDGKIVTGNFGTTENTFAQGNHTHNNTEVQSLPAGFDLNNYLSNGTYICNVTSRLTNAQNYPTYPDTDKLFTLIVQGNYDQDVTNKIVWQFVTTHTQNNPKTYVRVYASWRDVQWGEWFELALNNNIPIASTTTPKADVQNGAIGSGTTWAKADHQHPLSSAYATSIHTHGIADINPSSEILGVNIWNDDGTYVFMLGDYLIYDINGTDSIYYKDPTDINNEIATKKDINNKIDTVVGKTIAIPTTGTPTPDLNNYITPGLYWVNSNWTPDANTLLNAPIEGKAFTLLVDGKNDTVRQIATIYKNTSDSGDSCRTFLRMYQGFGYNTWSNWREIAFVGNNQHTHGNLQSDGSIGTNDNANKNVVTNASGKITTEAKYSHPSTHATTMITESSALNNINTAQNASQHTINTNINTQIGLKMSKPIAIPTDMSSGDTEPPNLDNYLTPGFYWVNSNWTPSNTTLLNAPIDGSAFTLFVDGDSKVIRQIATIYRNSTNTGNSAKTYVRMYSGYTDDNNVIRGWGPWKELAFTDSIPQASTTVPSADTANGSYGSGTNYARVNHTHPKSTLYAEATHTHSNATNSTNGFLSSTDKTNLMDSRILGYGYTTSLTASSNPSTASAFYVNVSPTNNITELKVGIIVAVYNYTTNNNKNATLNVNGLGAKPIFVKDPSVTAATQSGTNGTRIKAGQFVRGQLSFFMYSTWGDTIADGCWILMNPDSIRTSDTESVNVQITYENGSTETLKLLKDIR